MNSKKLLIIIILSLFALTFVLRAEENQIDKSESYKVKTGDNVSVNISSGDVLLKTWDKDEVLVQIVDYDDEVKGYKAEQRNNQLQITFNGSMNWAAENNFIITVPSGLFIDVKTGAGDLKIENRFSGSIKMHTNAGDVFTENIRGDIKLSSAGGDITCGKVEGNLYISTMGGEIQISDVTGNCSIETKGGDIRTKNVSGKLNAVTYGGDLNIGIISDELSLTTYGGEIIVEATNKNAKVVSYAGDILVFKSIGKIEINASAGDVQLNNSEGSVDIKSLSGDVFVSLIPKDHSNIKSSFGDIEIRIPADSKVKINAAAKTAFEDEKLIIFRF